MSGGAGDADGTPPMRARRGGRRLSPRPADWGPGTRSSGGGGDEIATRVDLFVCLARRERLERVIRFGRTGGGRDSHCSGLGRGGLEFGVGWVLHCCCLFCFPSRDLLITRPSLPPC